MYIYIYTNNICSLMNKIWNFALFLILKEVQMAKNNVSIHYE